MKPPFAQLAVIALLAAGCATYSIRTVPIYPPTNYPHRKTADPLAGLTVAVDVYGTLAKYKSVFDTYPSYDRGYLPINLIFFNDSTYPISLDPARITCATAGGGELDPIPVGDVVEQLLRETSFRYATTGLPGGLASKGVNDRIRSDFKNKALTAREIAPSERSQGFIFFSNSERLRTITVRGVRNVATGATGNVTIDLPETPVYVAR